MFGSRVWLVIVGSGIVLIAGIGALLFFRPSSNTVELPPVTSLETMAVSSTKDVVVEKVISASSTTRPSLPKSLRLDVPFLSQAPTKNWDMPYQEACEEASVLMVQAYYAKRGTNFLPEEGDRAIRSIVDWSARQYGPELVDMTAQEVATMVEAYMPELRAVVKPVHSASDIRAELARGYPVILPADGKKLANPHFRNGGPRYHMLVIKGYLEDGRWITNDPGTQFGEHFLYSKENLLESAHDWNDGDVKNGMPVMIVVTKKA